RNNVSFHYGGDSNYTDKEKLDILKDNYDKFSDDEEMFLYLGGNFGNYISTTQVVTLTSILNHMKSDSDEFSFPDSISSLFGEVTIITGRFQEFIVGCLDKIIGRHFPEKVQLISIPEPPIVNEVFCPFFVRPRTKPTD
ncbi:MAG: hypothetical protein HOL15_07110, partial [Nitrospinaceae bacterium]|nr:hypothetical protein [Nitrospinaceae bacterium]